ncbi:MAG: DUF982 domain-containing protein [Pararhizobium sp.]
MSDRLFDPPVFIKGGKYLIQEVAGLKDAIDMLEAWPDERRDLIYDAVLKACYGALDGRRPTRAARNAFVGFARRAGILEETGTVAAWMRSMDARRSEFAA